MLCSAESLSDTVFQWWVSCAKDGMKATAMDKTCEELGSMFQTSAHIVPRSWRGPTQCLSDGSGVVGKGEHFQKNTEILLRFFLGFKCLTF